MTRAWAAAAALLCATALAAGAEYPYSILHSFPDPAVTNDGITPGEKLVEDGGVLYGVTIAGGSANMGTVFSVRTDGSSPTILHHFGVVPTDGRQPDGRLLLDGGRLYGVAPQGGVFNAGALFALNTDGTGYAVLRSFGNPAVPNDGRTPALGVIMAEGKLYGLAASGGSPGNHGALYSINTDGTGYSILHRFGDPAVTQDGQAPRGILLYEDGTLYGMTVTGGQYSQGTVFSMAAAGGGYNILHDFGYYSVLPPDGAQPFGGLALAGGALYGMTMAGGPFMTPLAPQTGTVFSINTDGSGYTIVHAFQGAPDDGNMPFGTPLVLGDTLYGTTVQGGRVWVAGTLFSLRTDGAGFTIAHNFSIPPGDGLQSKSTLISDGSKLYGTAAAGGAHSYGVIFSCALPTPTPTPLPQAQVLLNGATFGAGSQFTATFQLNRSIERAFTAYAVVILPDGFMLDALTLSPTLAPVASNVPGLAAPYAYPLMNLTVPGGIPTGAYEVVAAFFDPAQPITGRADAFLEASAPFAVQ